MASWQRTVDCGALRTEHVGQEVVVNGWAHSVRDHGGVTFIDLRDRTGLVQIVVDPTRNPGSEAAHNEAQKLKSEYCLSIRGKVVKRIEGAENPNLATGDVEIEATELTILNPAKPLPFFRPFRVTTRLFSAFLRKIPRLAKARTDSQCDIAGPPEYGNNLKEG